MVAAYVAVQRSGPLYGVQRYCTFCLGDRHDQIASALWSVHGDSTRHRCDGRKAYNDSVSKSISSSFFEKQNRSTTFRVQLETYNPAVSNLSFDKQEAARRHALLP